MYFSGTERSPIGGDVYRVQLDGSRLTRLSERAGTHVAAFPPSMARYVDAWSDLSTPPQVRIHAADGTRGASDRRRAARRPSPSIASAGPS